MNVQQVAPYLPQQLSSKGISADQLAQGCARHAEQPQSAPAPYPSDMPKSEQVQWSRDIRDLAGAAQDEFRQQVGNPGATMRAPQLHGALSRLSEASRSEAKGAKDEIRSLKHAYWRQVGKTAGWMGGTLVSLAATGVLPNPITGTLAFVTAGLCVRSVMKARSAAKEIGQRCPQLENTARQATQLAAEASQCAALVGAWSDMLGPGKQSEAA